MKRYKNDWFNSYDLEESRDGEWVKYKDVKKTLNKKEFNKNRKSWQLHHKIQL